MPSYQSQPCYQSQPIYQPNGCQPNRRRVMTLAGAAALTASLRTGLLAIAGDDKKTVSKSTPSSEGNAVLPYMDRIGLQLYTLRNQMAEDPKATLKAVADAGYRQVELMDISDDAVELAAIARDHGLAVHSGFLNFNAITEPEQDGIDSVDHILEIGERIGLRHVVFGYIAKHQRDTADKCRKIADRANVAAKKTREAGMRMCYHNHSFEFAPFQDAKPKGKDKKALTAYDIFIERFDPQLMEFELDVFWAKIGGHDPIAMMRRLAGRISQVHLKDLLAKTPVTTDEGAVPKEAFQELGDGVINIPEVMRLAKEIGVDQCHVEQDQSPEPLASVAQSMKYLKKQSS